MRCGNKYRLMFLVSQLANGGLERALLGVIAALDPEKYEPVLVVVSGGGLLQKELPPGLKVITLFQKGQPKSFSLLALRALTRLYGEARRSNLLIGTCQPTHLLGKLLGLVSSRPNLAWVHYVWGAQPLVGRWGAIVAWAYRKTQNFVFVSQAAKERFINGALTAGASASVRLAVIYNPLHARSSDSCTLHTLDSFLTENPSAQPVLFVGRLVEVKNVSDLIKAVFLARRHNPFVFLVVVGTGPLDLTLKSEADELSRAERLLQAQLVPPVLFLGEDPNPLPLMRRVSVLALTSTWESWGVVAAEAMSEGCLVVAYEAPGGLREMLLPEKTAPRGMLVTDRAPDAMADKLLHALGCPADRFALQEEAMRFISTLGPTAVGQAWDDYLSQILRPLP